MKYIGYYDTKKNNRTPSSPAAIDKMNYIALSIMKNGINVDIISCSMLANHYIKACSERINKKISAYYFDTLPQKNSFHSRIFFRFYENLTLFMFLICKVKKNEPIIVYHSLLNMYCIYIAKKIKKFQLILEVEEFYNDINVKKIKNKKFEKKYIDCADKYIFPTQIINHKFNLQNKPYQIVHGTYQYQKNNVEKFNDNKIHIVYAGTFDIKKGGAITAIETAKFLKENYHLHILGFGNDNDTAAIKNKINEVNQIRGTIVSYEGMLIGKEYNNFLKKCDIGLSTQNPVGEYNDTSFPSKILSYMCCGLRVVTIKIPVVITSDVGKYISYYNNQNPKEIAYAIESINLKSDYKPEQIIQALDERFIKNIGKLIQD